jgi:SRSO17 transposase
MLTLDSSEQVKSGKESAGVARQYCGRLGKVENCQSGVFVGYVGDKGHRLLDARLYLPQKWFEDNSAERREKTGIPKDLTFESKPQIAGLMIRNLDRSGLFPAKWIGCDATFGMDREFLEGLPQGRFYFASIRTNLHVLTSAPEWEVPKRTGSRGKVPSRLRLTETPVTVADLAKTLPFTPMILKEGAKGPIGAFLHAC